MFGRIYKGKLKTIAEFWRMGGQITLGTDHFSDGNFLPGFGAHREIDAFVRSGIPPSDVLKIATINGAKALKIDKDHGSIEPDKVADLFIIEGNPLENIRKASSIAIRATCRFCLRRLKSRAKLGPRITAQMESSTLYSNMATNIARQPMKKRTKLKITPATNVRTNS